MERFFVIDLLLPHNIAEARVVFLWKMFKRKAFANQSINLDAKYKKKKDIDIDAIFHLLVFSYTWQVGLKTNWKIEELEKSAGCLFTRVMDNIEHVVNNFLRVH